MWLLLPALLLATLAIYQPAWHGGLLWDDDAHMTRPELQSVEGLRRIWFDLGATQQYYPVTHSAFWIQHKLWGGQTLGYHLLNILLHGVSAFLVALMLRRLEVPGAILAAVIFALHPVYAESVAWITELKNTLCGVFYLSAALAYLDFDGSRKKRPYVLALASFALAVLSKTVAATLPAALVVVIWWKRGRLDWRKDLLPLVPFFATATAGGLTTIWVERTLIGAQGADFQFTFVERGLIAGRATWFYLAKIVWPANLMFIYPRWEISQRVWWQYVYPLGALALVAVLWRLRTRSRAPLTAMLFFGGTLFPALGFFNVYPFRFSFVADHFQYLASISIIALAAAGLTRLALRWTLPGAPVVVTLVVAVPLGVLTWNQSNQYADAETLYRTAIAQNPAAWLMEANLGDLKLHAGSPEDLKEAVAHYERVLEMNPKWGPARNNLGLSWLQMGKAEEALAEFREAMRREPRFFSPRYYLGNALIELGRPQEAIEPFREALRLRPNDVETHNNLAGALLSTGQPEEAVAHLREALRLGPDSATTRANLEIALIAAKERKRVPE